MTWFQFYAAFGAPLVILVMFSGIVTYERVRRLRAAKPGHKTHVSSLVKEVQG